MDIKTVLNESEQLLAANNFEDMKQIAREAEGRFSEDDVLVLQEMGVDPEWAIRGYLLETDRPNRFMTEMYERIVNTRSLTLPQLRTCLDIIREEVMGGSPFSKAMRGQSEPNQGYKCYCGSVSDNLRSHLQHKMDLHDYELQFGSHEHALMDPTIVTESDEAHIFKGNLPRGCYAVPVPPSMRLDNPEIDHHLATKLDRQGGIIFVKVEYLRNRMLRNKRYVYGKIMTGAQYMPAGTMEVRFWESDRKELVGYQEPGGPYIGKYPFLLDLIGVNPAAWAQMFAMSKGHCAICFKSLTDEVSRALCIGPECEKKYKSLENYMKMYRGF